MPGTKVVQLLVEIIVRQDDKDQPSEEDVTSHITRILQNDQDISEHGDKVEVTLLWDGSVTKTLTARLV